MRHIKLFESFFDHSKVDTNKLFRYLDLEVPDRVANIDIRSIDVSIKRNKIYSDVLLITLKGDVDNITFEYLTNGNSIKINYCKVKIGDKVLLLRKSGNNYEEEEEEDDQVIETSSVRSDIDAIDTIIFTYFNELRLARIAKWEEEDDYEEEEEEEEEIEDEDLNEEWNPIDKIKKLYHGIKYKNFFSSSENIKFKKEIESDIVGVFDHPGGVTTNRIYSNVISVYFGTATNEIHSHQYMNVWKEDNRYKLVGFDERMLNIDYQGDEAILPMLNGFKTLDELIYEVKRRILILFIAAYIRRARIGLYTCSYLQINWNRIIINDDDYRETESLVEVYSILNDGEINSERLRFLILDELSDGYKQENWEKVKSLYYELRGKLEKNFKFK